MRIEILNGQGQVVDTILADAAFAEGSFPGAWRVAAVQPSPPAAAPRHITGLAFISRFTDVEAQAIDLASIGASGPAAAMRRYQKKVDVATYIDLDRADTRGGVQALEAAALLAAGRAAQILDGPISDVEIYRR